ncbi:MAG: AMIN domain-containing protein, partial [Burkholderiales bacterium]
MKFLSPFFLLGMMLAANAAYAATAISSVRVWPAQDYTRVTVESATPISYQMQLLKNPDRLALDLEDVNITTALQELSAKIGADDPYVKAVRVGRFKPGVVRLVFDLKTEAKPEVFTLKPIAEYGNRLVIDIYPVQAIDPLLALLEKKQSGEAPPSVPALGTAVNSASAPATAPNTAPNNGSVPLLGSPALKAAKSPDSALFPTSIDPRAKPPRPSKADNQRLVIVAIDAGHGGEDPGARGH